MPFEDVVDDGLMSIQRAIVLRKAGVDTVADEDFLLNPPSRSDLLDSAIRNIIRFYILLFSWNITQNLEYIQLP